MAPQTLICKVNLGKMHTHNLYICRFKATDNLLIKGTLIVLHIFETQVSVQLKAPYSNTYKFARNGICYQFINDVSF